MRKIIGYKLAIAVANEDKSVCDRVMDIVAEDARWELSGGVICVSDSGEPNAMVTLIQALVMYEEVKEPREAAGWTEADLFATGLCTRGAGHTGSCNGFWREQCGQFKALP